MKVTFIFLTTILAFLGCKEDKASVEKNSIKFILQDSIGAIESLISFNGKILFLDESEQLYVLNMQTGEAEKASVNLDSISYLFYSDSSSFISQSYDRTFKIIGISASNELLLDSIAVIQPDGYKYFENVFEDSSYSISSCCGGEWGGSAFFKDKTSGITYTTESTCLVNVDTFKGAYYLFNYQGHGRGFSSVTKIKDVAQLPEYDENGDLWCNWYYDMLEIRSGYNNYDSVTNVLLGDTLQNQRLLDMSLVRIFYGKTNETGVYIVYSDYRVLGIGRIEEKKLVQESIILDSIPSQYYTISESNTESSILLSVQTGTYSYKTESPKFHSEKLFFVIFDKNSFESKVYEMKD